jgi:hypothetical protein
LLLPEVGVGLVEPVLARRIEDVDVECILERFRLVVDVGRNGEHLAGADDDDLGFILADPELERTLDDVRDLLVVVIVLRHDASLLEIDVRDHHAVAGDQAAVEHGSNGLEWNVVPLVPGHGLFGGRLSHEARAKGWRCGDEA